MIEMNLLYYIMESTVDSYEKRNTIYIYIYVYIRLKLHLLPHVVTPSFTYADDNGHQTGIFVLHIYICIYNKSSQY